MKKRLSVKDVLSIEWELLPYDCSELSSSLASFLVFERIAIELITRPVITGLSTKRRQYDIRY
jgi:hypothetical protein